MDGRLLVLLRVAEVLLEDPARIDSFENRKKFQKALYLGQIAGVDLGYRYSWYLKGPYSTELARDYYALRASIDAGLEPPSNKTLAPRIKEKLNQLAVIFIPPNETELSQSDWLELLASWHYLRNVSRLDEKAAKQIMTDRKSNLVPFLDSCVEVLRKHDLMQ